MSRRVTAVVVSVCLIISIAASAEGQGSTSKPQSIVLEINIVETTGAAQNDLDRMEAGKTQLNRLIAEGKAKLFASLQVRTRVGDGFTARSGLRVPIQTAMLPGFRTNDRSQRDAREAVQGQTVAIPQIEYENTGLVLEGVASAAGEGFLDIRVKIEITGIDQRTGTLTPTFSQRTLSNAVRIKEGETVVLMGLVQATGGKLSLEQIASGASNPATGGLVVLLTTRPVQ